MAGKVTLGRADKQLCKQLTDHRLETCGHMHQFPAPIFTTKHCSSHYHLHLFLRGDCQELGSRTMAKQTENRTSDETEYLEQGKLPSLSWRRAAPCVWHTEASSSTALIKELQERAAEELGAWLFLPKQLS